jgi:hypothetical protein
MNKLAVFAVAASAFVAGVAVGKGKAPPPTAKFTAAEEVKWDDMGGVKLGTLFGDYTKGPFGGLLKVRAGYTSPVHSHTGAYEAVQISGTSSHWLKGEDGTKAKKMTPGSYWTFPAKLEHVSSCAPGAECLMFVWQKTKYDAVISKDAATTTTAGTAAGSAAGSAAGVKTGAAGAASAAAKAGAPAPGAATAPGGAKTGATAGTGAGAGSGAGSKSGTAAPGGAAPSAPKAGAGSAAPKK